MNERCLEARPSFHSNTSCSSIVTVNSAETPLVHFRRSIPAHVENRQQLAGIVADSFRMKVRRIYRSADPREFEAAIRVSFHSQDRLHG